MGRIIDKILILFLTIVIIAQAVSGTTRLIAIYMSVAVSALNYYLITKDRSDYGTELSDVKEKLAQFDSKRNVFNKTADNKVVDLIVWSAPWEKDKAEGNRTHVVKTVFGDN